MISPINSLSLFFNPMDLKKSLPAQWNKVFAVALAAIGLLILLYRQFNSRLATRAPEVPMNEKLIQSKNNLLLEIFPNEIAHIHTKSRVILIVEKEGQRFHQSVTAMDSTSYETITRTFNEKINHIENLNEIPRDATIRIGIIFTNPNLDHFSRGIGSKPLNGGGDVTSCTTGITINDQTKQLVSQQLNIPTEQLFDD